MLDFGADLSADELADGTAELDDGAAKLDDGAAGLDEGAGDELALDFGGRPSAESDDEAPSEFDDELTAGSESDDAPTIDFGEAEVTEGAADADEMALDFGQPVEAEEPVIAGEAEPVAATDETEEIDKKGRKKKKKEKKVKAAADGEPRPKRRLSGVLSATLGGLLGLIFALYGMMWLGPDYDFLGLGKMLPGFMVPSSVNKPTYVATQKPALDIPPAALPQQPLPDEPEPEEPPADDSAMPDAAADVPADPPADLPADDVPADDTPADDMPADSAPAETVPAETAPADDPFAPAAEPAADAPDLAGEAPRDAPAEMPADESAPAFPEPETPASAPPSQPEFPPPADEPATDPPADPFAPSADPAADPFAPSDMPADPPADAPPAETPAAEAATDALPSPKPEASETTSPAPPIAEPPAAEMPAPAADPFADTATTPGANDDPFADSPIQPEAPAEPAPEPVGPVDAAVVSPAALARSIQAAEAADQQMVAAQGTAAEAELNRIRANFYVSLFRMADGATFAKDDAQSGQLDVMRQEMDRFLRQLTNDPKRVESLKFNAGRWLGFPRRTTPGIILAGKVQSVEPAGKLHEIKLNIGLENAEESIVSVLSASDPGVNNGDDAVVLGTIVENPAQSLAGYEGSDPTVVWNGMLLNLSTQ
jgi:X-X-X-Leu-X-X-Gly heptad repeat protein